MKDYSKILAYFEENEDVFNVCIEELDSYNGYLGDDRYYNMEDMNELFCGQSIDWILARAYFGYDEESWTIKHDGTKVYGQFNPLREYFRFNGYGNFVSADYKDYTDRLDDWFVESLLENRCNLYFADDFEELSELLDALEGDEENEDF